MKALQGNRTITELCLSSNAISNPGARHIAHFIAEHNRNLTDLDLAGNSIGDTGVSACPAAAEGDCSQRAVTFKFHSCLQGLPQRSARTA